MMKQAKQFYSISSLAEEFNVSGRTIRFYEEKGLLSPRRTSGNQRIYSKFDRARLKLILRGKHLGLKLDEMVGILGLTDEFSELEQMHRAIQIGKVHLERINYQVKELISLKKEILHHGKNIADKLDKMGKLTKDQHDFITNELSSLKE